MKLSSAALLTLLSPSTLSFVPPSTPLRHSALSVGGGTLEPPSRDADKDSDSSSPSSDSTSLPVRRTRSSLLGVFEENQSEFLSNIGKASIEEVDPWDPNVYIKPRPGKYGWETIEQMKDVQRKKDLTLRQTLTDQERDDNLNMYKQLYEESVTLAKYGDWDGCDEARYESFRRRDKDPWFGLNERLEEAVKLDEVEEVQYLKGLIVKIGGAPPSLREKAQHPRGYVLENEIVGMTLTNERLAKLIDQVSSEMGREERRRQRVQRELKELEKPKRDTVAEEEAKIREQQEKNYELRIRAATTRKGPDEDEIKRVKEKLEKERKELMERWKELGVTEDPEKIANDFSARKEKLEKSMTGFADDMKRIASAYEDEDEDEYDEYGGLIDTGDRYAEGRPMSKAALARAEAMKNDGSGRPRLPGDLDVTRGELDPDTEINESSSSTSGPLTVEVNSSYNLENSDPPMRKHCFQYTVRITNNSPSETVQLLSRRFEIQTVGSSMKDVVQGEGVTGRQPILKPGEVFEYTSTAPLSVRPIGTTEIAARMSGEYRYCMLKEGQEKATEEQINKGQGEAGAELATFHFVFPEEQRVKPVKILDDDDDDEESVKTTTVTTSTSSSATPTRSASVTVPSAAVTPTPATSLPGDPDMTSGNISTTPKDASDTVTSDVRVVVTSTYRPERSDAKLDKHCFAYNVCITNESKSNRAIQLVSRRFEIQTIGSAAKDVVQGPGVTGRQPILKPGENFEYTSTAPLSVRPMFDKTKVVARMSGEYNFLQLADDGVSPLSSTPLKAELGAFHFILPEE